MDTLKSLLRTVWSSFNTQPFEAVTALLFIVSGFTTIMMQSEAVKKLSPGLDQLIYRGWGLLMLISGALVLVGLAFAGDAKSWRRFFFFRQLEHSGLLMFIIAMIMSAVMTISWGTGSALTIILVLTYAGAAYIRMRALAQAKKIILTTVHEVGNSVGSHESS